MFREANLTPSNSWVMELERSMRMYRSRGRLRRAVTVTGNVWVSMLPEGRGQRVGPGGGGKSQKTSIRVEYTMDSTCISTLHLNLFHVAIETKTSKPNNSASTDQPMT